MWLVPAGAWQIAWGVPMATDTAFVVDRHDGRAGAGGAAIPDAAAIVDDIGAIIVVAIFYSDHINILRLLGAGGHGLPGAAANRAGVYRSPYVVTGHCCGSAYAGGLHATLAGVLAAFIPTRPPLTIALVAQADAILTAGQPWRRTIPSRPFDARAAGLDAIHDRLESPPIRCVASRRAPVSWCCPFALANAGVVITAQVVSGHGILMAAIIAASRFAKPVGFILASWLAVTRGG